jgi:AAA domain
VKINTPNSHDEQPPGLPELPVEYSEVFDSAFESFFEKGKAERQEISWRPLTMAELLNESEREVSWILDTYLPDGALVLVVAFPKTGKTTFTYRLGVSVAQGKMFLGKRTRQCGVLILAVEEHRRDVKARLKWFGATADDPLYVCFARPQKIEALRRFIVENEIGLVIIDSLSRFWSIKDENNNAEVLRELSPLLDIAHETNTTVLLVHHERKSGGEDGRGIRGGSALFGAVDQAILLERLVGEPSNKRILKTIGRYDSTPEIIIELHENDYEIVGTPQELSEAGRVEKVLDVLTAEPQTVEVIMERASVSRKQCDKALRLLVDQGKVDQAGEGKRGDPHLYCLKSDSFHFPKGGNGKEKKQENPPDSSHISFLFDSSPLGEEKKETNSGKGVTAADAIRIFNGKVVSR